MMNCHFDGCVVKLEPGNAWVPAIQAIRQAVGRPVKTSDLSDHSFCRRHAHVLRSEGVKMYDYAGSFDELERREHEREQERAAASKFSTMYVALKAAGVPESKKQKRVRKARVATV